jgi:glycosyltransferase involved in cell wall biosynthesis
MIETGWPCITIVVPSYNQAPYLGSTLQSIFDQDYPYLEVIVMDGGSTDGSLEVIKSYSDRLTYWQSQPDGGQTSAIRAGIERGSGELLSWLNSDDILLPNVLWRYAQALRKHPEADVLYGHHLVIDRKGTRVEEYKHPKYFTRLAWWTAPYIAQPGTFFTRHIWQLVDGVDQQMQAAFDYDLWYRFMTAQARFVHVGGFVSGFRLHPVAKSQTWQGRYAEEYAVLRQRYAEYLGTKGQRCFARLALVSLQTVSGNYWHTLWFRLVHRRTVRRYKPESAS